MSLAQKYGVAWTTAERWLVAAGDDLESRKRRLTPEKVAQRRALIAYLRQVRNMTYQQIGDIIGLTKQRVGQILDQGPLSEVEQQHKATYALRNVIPEDEELDATVR